MKSYSGNFTKSLTVASGVVIIVGAVSFLPWRLFAQERNTTGETTRLVSTGEGSGLQSAPRRAVVTQNYDSTVVPEGSGGAPRIIRQTTNEPPSRPAPPPPPPPPTEIAPARFEATVYELQMPRDRIADLDAQALEASADRAQSLMKALEGFGGTRILYKIDQPVNLYVESIALKSSEPVATESLSEPSQTANAVTPRRTINYVQTGFNVNISASTVCPVDLPDTLIVQVLFQLNALAAAEASAIKSPRILEVKLSRSGTPKFGKPTVLLNVSSPNGDTGKALAYVICYVFKETGK